MPMSRLAGGSAVMSSPSTRTRPASGFSKPATTFRSVVLPEPLGPRMVRSSPGAMSSETPSSARTSPKRRVRPSTVSLPALSSPVWAANASSLLQHPGVPQFLRLVAVLGVPGIVDPELLVEILRRQIGLHLGVDEVQRVEIEPGIAELGGIDRLLLGHRHLGQHLLRPVDVLGAARNDEAALLESALAPFDLDRRALLDDVVEAAVPAGRQHDLLVEQELRGRLAGRPPRGDVRLDLVELLEGAVEVDGIELVHRHAIGQQRELQIVGRMVAHGARARELLGVPPFRPGLGMAAAFEDVAAIADDGGVDRRGKNVGAARLLGILRAVDDLVVDLVDEVHLGGADGVLAADLGDVPFDIARVDHGAQLAEVGGARLDDADAVFLLVAGE